MSLLRMFITAGKGHRKLASVSSCINISSIVTIICLVPQHFFFVAFQLCACQCPNGEERIHG